MYYTRNDFQPPSDHQFSIDRHPVMVNKTMQPTRMGAIKNMRGAGFVGRRPRFTQDVITQKRFEVPGLYDERKPAKLVMKMNKKRKNLDFDMKLRPIFAENNPVARFRNLKETEDLPVDRQFLTDIIDKLIVAQTLDPEDGEFIRVENEIRKANPNMSEADVRTLTARRLGRTQRRDNRQVKLLTLMSNTLVSSNEKLQELVKLLSNGTLNTTEKRKDALKLMSTFVVNKDNIDELASTSSYNLLVDSLVDLNDTSDRIFDPKNETNIIPLMKFYKEFRRRFSRRAVANRSIPIYFSQDSIFPSTVNNDSIVQRFGISFYTADRTYDNINWKRSGFTLGNLLVKINYVLDWVEMKAIHFKKDDEQDVVLYELSGFQDPTGWPPLVDMTDDDNLNILDKYNLPRPMVSAVPSSVPSSAPSSAPSTAPSSPSPSSSSGSGMFRKPYINNLQRMRLLHMM